MNECDKGLGTPYSRMASPITDATAINGPCPSSDADCAMRARSPTVTPPAEQIDAVLDTEW